MRVLEGDLYIHKKLIELVSKMLIERRRGKIKGKGPRQGWLCTQQI